MVQLHHSINMNLSSNVNDSRGYYSKSGVICDVDISAGWDGFQIRSHYIRDVAGDGDVGEVGDVSDGICGDGIGGAGGRWIPN